ncbi:hypothetical protein ACVNF4_14345 [Streptomyces sp. S6]
MNWSRAVAVTAAGLVLCGCAGTADKAETAPGPRVSAHTTRESASSAPATPAQKPSLDLNGRDDARPGKLIQMILYWVDHAQGGDAVVVRSAAFDGPVRLKWDSDNYWALVTVPMTTRPGSYPLTLTVRDRVIVHDTVKVLPSQRPSFTLSASDVTRPGESVSFEFDDLYPGEKDTDFTVRSAALAKPVRLVHNDVYDYYNPRAFSASPQLKADLADGTYTFTLCGPGGRRIAEKSLKVRASKPGDRDYLGSPSGPDLYDPGRSWWKDAPPFKVRAGHKVGVMWHDLYPDPGEENTLTATSPAFTGVLRLPHDITKGADGDDPRFNGEATIRPGLKPGRYPVTVVAHHGRVKRTAYVTVTAG